MQIISRKNFPRTQWQLEQMGIHPLLAQLYAARGITQAEEIDCKLKNLLPPDSLKGTTEAAQLLAHALATQKKICIVADYDCDGATACSVGLRGLKMLGFEPHLLNYIVPDRINDGYGLTPAIADRVKAFGADILMTVDNGIASITGVEHAKALGMEVIITDHHLPACIDGQILLPPADAIVNPNQPGCAFASKAMAGVGVMFYVLMALRTVLRTQGLFTAATQPRLDTLLDLVALGTVADVVTLDTHNRRLVTQGLERIRKGRMHVGIAALFQVAKRAPATSTPSDMGFALGPRLNAAGRLSDMTLGIECLTTDDPVLATQLAQILDQINHERKDIEADMLERSLLQLEKHLNNTSQSENANTTSVPAAMALFDEQFHEGVVGILASRIKEQFYRPAFVFAPSQAADQTGLLKGSGRSITGFHLRDALDLLEKKHPGLLLKFGGHAMAAGCTIRAQDFPHFANTFAQLAKEQLDPATLSRKMPTDGDLPSQYLNPQIAKMLRDQVWGCGFPAPVFSGTFEIRSQRVVGEKHLALKLLNKQQVLLDAIWFGRSLALPNKALLAYRLDIDEWQGVERVRLVIEGMDEPSPV